MSTVAVQINPRKLFRFAVLCDGLETAFVQKVKLPKIDIKSAKHGNGPFVIKTASKVEFGDLELETLKPSESSVVWWKDWIALIINLGTGAQGIPHVYKKTLVIFEYAADGITVVDTWEVQGCFPVDVDMTDLDKLAEGNAIDKLKISVDIMTYTGSGDPTMPFQQGR